MIHLVAATAQDRRVPRHDRLICEFRVPLPPQAWERVEGVFRKRVPKKTRAAEDAIGWVAKQAMAGRPPHEGPVKVTQTFYVPRPAHIPPGMRYPIQHGAPDGDNLLKTLLDGMAGIVYVNDRQVVQWPGAKVFADGEPYTHVLVEAL